MKMNKPVLAGALAAALLASGATLDQPRGDLQPQAALYRVLTYDWGDPCKNPGGWLSASCSGTVQLPTPRLLNALRRAGVTDTMLSY